MRHFKSTRHSLGALIVDAAAGARLRLLEVVDGEDAKGNRHARLAAHLLQPARALSGHVLKVRRVPTNHTAESNNCLIAAADGEPARSNRQFKGARYARDE